MALIQQNSLASAEEEAPAFSQRGEREARTRSAGHSLAQLSVTESAVKIIVEEYTAILSDLACLTAELPRRLQIINFHEGQTNSNLNAGAYSDEPLPLGPEALDNRVEDESHVDKPLTEGEGNADLMQADKTDNPQFETKLHDAFKYTDTHFTTEMETLLGTLRPAPIDTKNAGSCFGRCYLFLHSDNFDAVVGFLILLNSIATIIRLEYEGYLSNVSLGKAQDGSWEHAADFFDILEHSFNAVFLLEICLRALIFGRNVLLEGSVILDIVLVLSSSLKLYVLDPLEVDGINLNFLRLLRFVKFMRLFRLVRVLNLFSPLRILGKTVIASVSSLVWSMMLLMFIIVIVSLFLCELLTDYIRDPEADMGTRSWVNKHYGSSFRAMYTLFEVTLAGCWPTYFRPLIEHVSVFYVVFAVAYVSVVVFAIIRIITSMFLRETLLVASNDLEMMMQDKMKQKSTYAKKLETIFMAVDTSGDGKLSKDEFIQIINHPRLETLLQTMQIEVHDAMALFDILDSGDGTIAYEEFTKGLMRVKGQARTMDIVAIMHGIDKMWASIHGLRQEVSKLSFPFPPQPLHFCRSPDNRLSAFVQQSEGALREERLKEIVLM